jgi:hypothetical protein
MVKIRSTASIAAWIPAPSLRPVLEVVVGVGLVALELDGMRGDDLHQVTRGNGRALA